jgi:hypothetical protein
VRQEISRPPTHNERPTNEKNNAIECLVVTQHHGDAPRACLPNLLFGIQ